MKNITKEFVWFIKETDPPHLDKHEYLDEQINEWLKNNSGYIIKNISVLTLNHNESLFTYHEMSGRVIVVFEKD